MAIFTSRNQKKEYKVTIKGQTLYVEKPDGHQTAFPLAFYPQLLQATEEQRSNWTVTDYGLKWAELGVEIPV